MSEESTAITLATEQAQAELTQAEQAQAALDELTITSPEDSEFAADILRDVKAKHKAIEAKRKAITGPLLKAKKEVDDLFRPVREALELAEATLKDKIAGYLESVEASNAQAAQDASTAETADEASAALANMQETETPTGVSVRYTWEPEVFNEGLLMPQFLSPDYAKIKAWMKEHADADGKPLPIPGVRFHQRRIVSSRSK